MLQKGQLYLRNDGTTDPVSVNIRHKRFLFGSLEYCTVRIYIDGIFPEHCVITIENKGKAYLEALHPSAITSVNDIKIKQKTLLKDYDVISICGKEFQFTYPPKILSSNLCTEKLLLIPHSKQMKSAEIFNLEKNLETPRFRECNALNTNCTPNKPSFLIKSDIFEDVLKYLLKSPLHEPGNISFQNIPAQENFSCSGKCLTKYMNYYGKETFETRKKLSLKLYEFFYFIKGLLLKNEEHLIYLLPIMKCVGKFNIVRAREDILYLPSKYLYIECLNLGQTTHKKSLQARILSESPRNVTSSSEMMSDKKNIDIEQKQIKSSSRKISISYKKRVSLAVKRYHLRKRKSIVMIKCAEIGKGKNLMTPDERQNTEEKYMENICNEQIVTNLEEQTTLKTKKKHCYNKKEEIQDKRELKKVSDTLEEQKINIEAVMNTFVKENVTSEKAKKREKKKTATKRKDDSRQEINIKDVEKAFKEENITTQPTKGKQKIKKTVANKTGNLGKENIEKLPDISFKNEIAVLKSKEKKKSSKSKDVKQESIDYLSEEQSSNKKLSKAKQSCKRKKNGEANDNGKSAQECNIQKLSQCQRITRSMAKNGP